MSNPVKAFKRVETYRRSRGGNLVAWEMHPSFQLPDGAGFEVEFSTSGVDPDWALVWQGSGDQFLVEDPIRRSYGMSDAGFYRVRTFSGVPEYVSEVVQAGGDLSRAEQLILRAITDKERLRMEKRGGTCGYLYKRRVWGDKCLTCTDPDTGEVVKARCTECYGTGIVGGYFTPVAYWTIPSNPRKTRGYRVDPDRGGVDDQIEYFRGLNCPWLSSGDVWVNYKNDRRYIVHAISDLQYAGTVWGFDPIEMRLVPSSDIIYDLPRPDDVESSLT